MLFQRIRPFLLPIVYLCASYQFLRYYVTAPFFYLDLLKYFAGKERLPFQLRVFPILFLEPLRRVPLIQKIAAGRVGPMHNPDRLCFFLLSCVAFAFIYYFMVKLYRLVSSHRQLEFLLFPVLLFILTWTYVIHIEQDFSYPYDMPSLAFFTAGIYFVYRRRFLPLLFIILAGTTNRETTLFVIGLYILDGASIDAEDPPASFLGRFDFKRVPWLRAALLTAIWVAVKLVLWHQFRWNDRSEDYLRIRENIVRVFTPLYWPAVLNLAGFVLPFVILFHRRIRPLRFANYLYILIPWVTVMFVSGIILETRVYGELSCYVAICAVLLLEHYVENLGGSPGMAQRPAGSSIASTGR